MDQMDDANDECSAKFMAESLLNHARGIYLYAVAYCGDTPENMAVSPENRAIFRRHVKRMLREMYNLMLLARTRGISRHCNREQIEAYVAGAEEILAAATVPAAGSGRSQAMLN